MSALSELFHLPDLLDTLLSYLGPQVRLQPLLLLYRHVQLGIKATFDLLIILIIKKRGAVHINKL